MSLILPYKKKLLLIHNDAAVRSMYLLMIKHGYCVYIEKYNS